MRTYELVREALEGNPPIGSGISVNKLCGVEQDRAMH